MKEWKFKKGINDVLVTINDKLEIVVTINNASKVGAILYEKKPILAFSRDIKLIRNGKKSWCKGFNIEPGMHKEIKVEIQKLKEAAEKQHQLEYDTYLSGKKKIELIKDEPDDFCFTVDYLIKSDIAREVLRDMGCLSGGVECGCIERLTSELKDKINMTDCTIDIKDCIDFNRKCEEEKRKKKEEEMLKPAIQSFNLEDKKAKIKVGDIIHRGYCEYVVDKIIEDIDYPELKTFICHRKEEK